MNNNVFRSLLGSLLVLACWQARGATQSVEPWQRWAQRPIESPLALQVSVRAGSGTEVYVSLAGNTFTNTGAGLDVDSTTNSFTAQLEPHEPYTLGVTGGNVGSVSIKLEPFVPRQVMPKKGPQSVPKPYRLFLNALSQTNLLEVEFESAGNNATNYTVEVRPDRGFRPASLLKLEDQWSRDEDPANVLAPGDGLVPEIGPGRDTAPALGAFRWGVSLGRLWNGRASGLIRLNEEALAARTYTAAPLCYTARSTNIAELMVITNASGQLRQIRAPQTLVDIQGTNQPNEQCVIRFYLLSQVGTATNGSGLFPINTDDPFVTWRIKNPDAVGTSNRVQIIEERPGRTYTSEIQYSNQVWSLKTGSGGELRTETRSVSVSGPVRTETVEIKSPTNTVYKAIETYRRFDWGWELTNVVSNPDGYGLTNSFTFYESSAEPNAYRKLKDHWYPGGRWERMYYVAGWDENPCPSWPFGDVTTYFPFAYHEVKVRPWEDGPSSPETAALTNVVQEITEYTGINIGAHTSWYHDEYLGPKNDDRSMIFMSSGVDGSDLWGLGLREERGIAGSTWETWQDVFIYERPGHYLHDLPHNVVHGDERAEYYDYGKGTFDWNTRTFTEDETNGVDFCSQVTHGSDGTAFYAEGCYPWCYYDDGTGPAGAPEVHLGKATQEVAVYQQGSVVYKQMLALQAIEPGGWYDLGVPVFSPFEQRILTYDSLGHLTNEVWMDVVNSNVTRTVYQASWVGANGRDCELKTWEISEAGEKLTFAYDSLKRLTNVTRVGVSAAGGFPAQSDIATNYVYDAAGRVKTEAVAAGTLSQARTVAYDLAGRVTSSSGFDGVTTNIAYSADTRVITETRPGGITAVTSYYLDGRLKSVTGTGGVNEYYDYSVTDDSWLNHWTGFHYDYNYPKNITRISTGSQGSSRWREEVTNLGRVKVCDWSPGFAAMQEDNPLEVFYATAGGLVLSQRVPYGMDGTNVLSRFDYYTHNGYGEVIGSSLNATRWAGEDSLYEHDGTNWFLTAYSLRGLDQGWITNAVRQRLSGFTSGSVLADVTVTDPDTNITLVTVYLDRAAKKLTTISNTPQSTINITNVAIDGLLQMANSASVAAPTWVYYDAFGRVTSVTDPLGFSTSRMYDPATGWVTNSTDATSQKTGYQYYGPTEANAGKLKCQTAPNGKRSRYDYTARGEPQHVWGDVPYPEERVYNSYGEMTELHTYQGGTSWATATTWPGAGVTAQTTTWNYDGPTGLLLAKVDAQGRSYTNNYLFTRTLWTLTWARGVTITNTFNEYGEVVRKDYSDGTPSIAFDSLNLAGQPTSITDAAGTSSLSYDFASRPLAVTWNYDGASPLYGLTVNNQYDPVFGPNQVKLDSWGTPLLVHDYGYDPDTGRMGFVSNDVFTATYGYKANSDLLQTTTCRSNTTTVLTTTRSWEYGMRLGAILNEVNGVNVSSHSYTYDSVNRRTRAALEDGSRWDYGYNDRNELTGARRYWYDLAAVAGQQFGYDYDSIGNRKTAQSGGDTNGANLRPTGYAVNSLNQYTTLTNLGYADVLGAALATNTVWVNTNVAERKGEYFRRELQVGNVSGPVWTNVTVASGGVTNTGGVIVPDDRQALTYDLDGNLTFDGTWTYEWDAENRLRAMTMTNAIAGLTASNRLKLEFVYDFMNRRVQKVVSTNSTGSDFVPQSTNRFVYDGWNLIAVIDPECSLLQSFAWGQDLSGTMQVAGGIGGLLLVTAHGAANTNCFAGYDGNGNVMLLVNAGDKSTAARYEYSAFGETLRATGPLAKANPFCFSTKFADDEGGLVYYGRRYYSPGLGRFVNRDPIGEEGGMNLQAMALNNLVDGNDPLGMMGASKRTSLRWYHKFKGGMKHELKDLTDEEIREMEKLWESEGRPGREKWNKRGGTGDRRYGRGAAAAGLVMALGFTILQTAYTSAAAAENVLSGVRSEAGTAQYTVESYLIKLSQGDQGMADLDAAVAALEITGGAAGDVMVAWGTLQTAGQIFTSLGN